MKKILFLLVLTFSISSCKEKSEEQSKSDTQENLEPVVDVNKLISDYNTWWSYHYYNISLSSDFKPLDTQSEVITKEEFLKKLTSGKYIPIEMKSENSKIYKLYEIPQGVDKAISSTIKATSANTYNFFKMEGTKFPDFDLVDLEGNHYDNESLKGKTTVMKIWFIACKPCIAEMPELNELVNEYKDYNDIQFLSLALDSKQSLKEFLNKKEFKYAVAAEQKDLIQNKLNLRAYPTHLIVDETGSIEKVFNTASELISYLKKNEPSEQNDLEGNLPPPPPPPPAPTIDDANNKIPPPPPPPLSHEDAVQKWMKEGAVFYYNEKEISGKEALEIVQKNDGKNFSFKVEEINSGTTVLISTGN